MSEVDMQKTGFVQIPIQEFMTLLEVQREYIRLSEQANRDENARRDFIKDFVRLQFNRDSLARGENVIIVFKSIPLLKYLGVDKHLKQVVHDELLLNNSELSGVHLYLEEKYEDTQAFIKEVNNQ